MAQGSLEVILTRLAGGPQLSASELAAVSADEWRAIATRAAEHRLGPGLHRRWQGHNSVPRELRDAWREDYRAAAIEALVQRQVLVRLTRRLAEAGIPSIALKGAWLAWHVYREPALRPLRDLDLLVRPEHAARARELALEWGWDEPDPSALAPEAHLAAMKHLPELRSPEGVWLDLHARLWDLGGTAPPMPAGLWERARPDPEQPAILYLAPEDQLMHLAIHATAHRFDGGPLMLGDIDRLLARHRFDWPAVRARATEEGWRRHLDLVLAAGNAWGCQGIWRGPASCGTIPAEILADIPYLLAKPVAVREADIGAAKRGRADIGRLEKLRRIWVRRRRYATFGQYSRWLAGEIRLALAARGDAQLAQRAARNAALDRLLKGG